MRFVDANVILRYVLDDDPQFAEKAARILEQEQVHVPFEVMAEVVYVMQGVYKASRQDFSMEGLECVGAKEGIEGVSYVYYQL